MKALLLNLTLIGMLLHSACKNDLITPGGKDGKDMHSSIVAEVPKADGVGTTTVRESEGALTLAYDQPIALKVDNPFDAVGEVEWSLDGERIGTGNSLQTTIRQIGVHRLRVTYRVAGNRHARDLDVYAYVTKRLSFSITPTQAICGKVAIGITQYLEQGGKIGPGYSKATVQDICTTDGRNTATAANVEVNFFSHSPKLKVELIEPREVKDDSRTRFCLLIFFCIGGSPGSQIAAAQLYDTYAYEGGQLDNLQAGTYQSGACTLTIH